MSELFKWNPMDALPEDTEPAYLLARLDIDGGADWYYRSAYLHRWDDIIDDDDAERFMAGEFEWFEWIGGEPFPLDTSRYQFWCAIHRPSDPDDYWQQVRASAG